MPLRPESEGGNMNTLISISTRVLWVMIAAVAMLRTNTQAGSPDERFKASINTMVLQVKETQNPDAKRKILGDFLIRMDRGLGMAENILPKKEGPALEAFRLKMQADYAGLTGKESVKIPDVQLNQYALYVQQDAEQADQVVYIGGGGLILIIILLILLL